MTSPAELTPIAGQRDSPLVLERFIFAKPEEFPIKQAKRKTRVKRNNILGVLFNLFIVLILNGYFRKFSPIGLIHPII
jgi:hypothetical protein